VPDSVLGVHHVTAIAGDPQRNLQFYTRLLGLRLVKRTVNFDDPTTYHLYYGDEAGHPGTLLTFFPWPNAPRGQSGSGQASTTSFAIPRDSINFWSNRLREAKVELSGPSKRFDETVLSFSDPDGLKLELIGVDNPDPDRTWSGGPIPEPHGIRGLFGVTLIEESISNTHDLLTKMGFHETTHDGSRYRYTLGSMEPGKVIDILHAPHLARGHIAVGSVHHVAWRTSTDEEQNQWRGKLVDTGIQVTPVIDRIYFHSIYFREPGGVLFEIATDPPGFSVDEFPSKLGTDLMLPPWLEPMRPDIQRTLAPIQLSYS